VLNVSGEHMEVWCVPSATHVPGIGGAVTKFPELWYSTVMVGYMTTLIE